MVKTPKPIAITKDTLTQFVPWEIGDHVPPWLRDHIDVNVIRDIGIAHVRAQREILEIRVRAAQNLERMLTTKR